MHKKKYLKMSAAVMAAVLTVQGMGTISSVNAEERLTKVRSDSQVQMSSDPEVVYVNNYSDATVRTQNFDSNWKFYLGEAGDAQESTFDDSKWRQLSLPHDYSIEQEYSQKMEAESGYLPGGTGWYRKKFTVGKELEGKELRVDFGGVYMNATVWVNGHQLGTHPYGYTPFSFDITDYVKYGEENVIAVKVDHKTPSSRWYSGSGIYRSVNLTVMDKVHVDLYGTQITTDKLEEQQNGNVDMNIATKVVNESEEAKTVTVTHKVFPKGEEDGVIGTVTTDAKEIAAGATENVDAVLQALNPTLWSVENPALYTVRTEVKIADEVVDTYDTEYGFRYFNFDSNTGFSLNGENVKLKGVCMHHDQGALGAVANRRAIERQVEILQEMGCNSIRVTHNPASDELIEICNEKGMLVIDEAFDPWTKSKNGNSQDYAKWFNVQVEDGNEILGASDDMTWAQFDLRAMVKRGYNAPSIIMWSLGNEVMEGISGGVSEYPDTAKKLIDWTTELDTTRPVTTGDNKLKAYWKEAEAIGNAQHEAGGTVGFNYCDGALYDDWHQKHPEWKMYGAETASAINSRGIYHWLSGGGQTSDKQLTSYDVSAVGWGAVASSAWYDTIQRDFLAGEYVWTGFDYIGEPTPWNGTGSGAIGSWESPKSSYFGIIDTAGFPKDSYYFYQSQWNEDVNTLHVLPAWNENVVAQQNGKVPVVVYSDAASVELFFTPAGSTEKQSLGKKEFTQKTTEAGYTYQVYEGADKESAAHKNMYLTWKVPYQDGTIEAVAYDKSGNVIQDTQGRSSVTTTDKQTKLEAKADRTEIAADGTDLSYITVDVKDKDGNIVPDASDRVKFTVEGDGVLVGVDNGSSPDHDSYKASDRKAFSGKVLAIVQSTKNAGTIKVTAQAEGLESASVQIQTTPVDDGSSGQQAQVDSFYMVKTYYVKAGNMPELPETIETRYTDGTSKELPVVWDEITEDQMSQPGGFTVNGEVEGGYAVSVYINVIDEIGGLLNYSATTPVGTAPALPESRPAVMQDGTILTAAFAVDWEEPDAGVWNKEGIVEVLGKANVLGQEVEVKATIRVQQASVTIGNSVSGNAMNLTQNIPADQQSDTLDAIKDGSTEISDNTSGGANPTAWSNWQYSQNGNTKSEITFEYATQQMLGQIVMHFAKDSGSMRYPDAGVTEIYVSDDGDNWTKLEAKETIGTENGRVKPYTYDFAPTGATFVKFCLTNTTQPTGTAQKACTALTEIELKVATTDFVTNTNAALEKLTVNGKELSSDVIASGQYSTRAASAQVEAIGADNTAVTVLPAYNDVIRILMESEDHTTRDVFEIYLNTETPEDDSMDYPVDKMTAIAGSAYSGTANEGPARYVLDGNASTHWHTNWSTTEGEDVSKRWIGVELEEAAILDAVRYLPRTYGGTNGAVTEYKVQYRLTEEDEWQDAATGTWDAADTSWKLIKFEEPVEAKYVRVVGVHTWADSGVDKHMSTAELRVRLGEVKEKIDISNPESGVAIEVPEKVEAAIVDAENPVNAVPTVTIGEKALSYGTDYLLEYANNTAYGTATVTIKGIGAYTGEVSRDYEIVKPAEKVLTGIFVEKTPDKTTYTAGENFDPTGLSIKLLYDDQSEEIVAYNEETKDEFSFSPSLSTALGKDDKKVTVTYREKTAVVDIVVNEEEIPEKVLTSIAVAQNPAKTTYKAGENFDPTGLSLRLVYSDGTEETVAYSAETAADFGFTPALSVPLEEGNQNITVIYGEKEAVVAIKVEAVEDKKEELENVIAAADELNPEDYTEESYAEFEKALKEAKAVLNDADADDDKIQAAIDNLRKAMENLENVQTPEIVNKDELKKLLDITGEYASKDYTEEAFDNLVKAYVNALEVYNDKDATQDEVDAAYAQLLKAKEFADANKVKDPGKDPGKDDGKGDNQKPGTTVKDKAAKTGDTVNVMPIVFVLFTAGVAIAVVYFKRKRAK